MLANKNVKIGDREYIINGLDAISSISLLTVFQRVAQEFTNISQGAVERTSPEDFKADLEYLFFKSKVLREIRGETENGNPLAKEVKHHSQMPDSISLVGDLVREIGSHIYGYEIPEDETKKK